MMRRILEISLLFIAFLSFGGKAYAQDVSSQEAKKAKLEREIAIIDRQLAENASQSSTMLSDLNLIRRKISNRKALVAEADKQVRFYNDSIYLTNREINRLKVRIDTLTSHYSRLVRSAYKNRDARVWYMYMFASKNLGQAFRRFGYFRTLSSQMKSEARKIKDMQDELGRKKERLSQLKKEAEVIKNARQKEVDELRKDEAKSDSVVKRLQKDKKKYQNKLAAKKKEVNALNREIARIIAQTIKTDDQKKDQKKSPVDMKLDGEFANNKGKLPWPAEGPLMGRFGKQYHAVYKNIELPQNNGIDIALGKGEQVKAVFDGVVSKVFVMPGYNQCVLVQHGNYFTLYCKMKGLSVKAGDKVIIDKFAGTKVTLEDVEYIVVRQGDILAIVE